MKVIPVKCEIKRGGILSVLIEAKENQVEEGAIEMAKKIKFLNIS